MKKPEFAHGYIRFGEGWIIADPTDDKNVEAYGALCGKAYPLRGFDLDTGLFEPVPDTVQVDRVELQRLLKLAEAYLHLGTYELGVGCVIGKLRDIRKALRDAGKAR